jgi:hypothetical protein
LLAIPAAGETRQASKPSEGQLVLSSASRNFSGAYVLDNAKRNIYLPTHDLGQLLGASPTTVAWYCELAQDAGYLKKMAEAKFSTIPGQGRAAEYKFDVSRFPELNARNFLFNAGNSPYPHTIDGETIRLLQVSRINTTVAKQIFRELFSAPYRPAASPDYCVN